MLLSNFSSPFYVIFGLLIGFMNYRNTDRYRKVYGRSPWGIPPIVWGIASLFLSLVVTLAALIAMNTGNGARRRNGTGGPGPGGGTFGTGPYGGARPPFGGQVPAPPASTQYAPGEFPDSQLHPSGRQPTDVPASTSTPATLTTAPTAPPSWQPDPSGRFDFRYWGGDEWTEFVTKDGEQSTDPF